ncbi:MAG: hypothetical protein HY723_06955 [Chloroflexi bacterium]|nr:hypothetical protein [Chloroflexota bacterium]
MSTVRGALAAVVLCLAAISFACDDGGTASITPSPTPSPGQPVATATAPPSATGQPGAEGYRAFASQVQAAADAEDAPFFTERVRLSDGICTEADVAGGIGAAPCDSVGEPWAAFPIGYWRSEGELVSAGDGVAAIASLWERELPGESDDFGGGATQVYALALLDDASEAGWTILTAIIERPPDFGEGDPIRVARVLLWQYDGERWRLRSLLVASVLAEEFLIPCNEALDYTGGSWERFPDPRAPRLSPDLCPF